MAMAAQAKVLSGSKLEQLVVRLQRHSGRPKEACWRFIIQYGITLKLPVDQHPRRSVVKVETSGLPTIRSEPITARCGLLL
jgi:hypothetical protein